MSGMEATESVELALRERIRVVLVRPLQSGNIGAAARAL